jgi:hypothetical protein
MPDLSALAADAYVYGFPLVFDLDEVQRFTETGVGSLPPAGFNEFSHAAALAGPRDTFVSVNNDTVYSIAQLDLSTGPLLLQVPDTGGRYYVLQFVDAWTNNFAYVGRRATGTGAGMFVLVPTTWSGDIPAGTTRITSPTMIASIVGRWACDGHGDLPAVRSLQQATTLEPWPADLSATPSRAARLAHAGAGLPRPEVRVPEDLMFFEKMRARMRALPPAAPDAAYQQTFAPLGLLDDPTPYLDADPALAEALRSGAKAGRERIEQASAAAGPEQNHWRLPYHVFDYNADFHDVGTIDDPQWIIADRAAARLLRAAAARAGLWGNHGYEAAYAMTYQDANGDALDGRRRYTMRLAEAPPVDAFWSITMYDMPDFYLVDNEIDRYSVGDRTPGLRYAEDGSLTLYLQPDRPGDPLAAANWLPTPHGPFRPILRMYQPRPAVLDGTYALPPITPAG